MKLEVSVADVSQSRKDLTIEIAADEVKAEFEKTYDSFARYAKVPGFRPGRVPRGVLKQRFGKDVKDDVFGRLLPHALHHAIVDNKLHVIGEPYIDDISFSEGEPLKFKASVEIIPEFEIKEYKGLKGTRQVAKITDESIDKVVERWRESAAEFVPVEDRPSQIGDFVSVNLVGKYVEPQEPQEQESQEQEDLKADDVEIELGAEGVQAEFNEHLVGVKAGDVREFRVAYPEDFTSKGLAGKTLDFTASVVAVRRKEFPEIDDEFAKETGDYENVQQMRDKIRERLTIEADRSADSRLRDQLLERALKPYDFEIPESLIEKQAEERLRELAYYMMRSGMSRQSMKDINWEERMNEARTLASRDVLSALVVSRISDAEEIKITADEIDAEVERMAQLTGETPDQLKARLTKDDALSSIENRLRYQKTLDVIVNNAEITVEELTGEQDSGDSETEATPENAEGSQPL